MDGDLTYLVGGRERATPIPDGIDLIGYVFDLFSLVDVPEMVVELLFGLLECL
ncbi:MAG TPA: hypothetical protein VJW94_09570 [Candidatus Acidoferrum sp.]|nr:hypothetical protein [Candidatus Acidoferrum sp.]